MGGHRRSIGTGKLEIGLSLSVGVLLKGVLSVNFSKIGRP